jgi:hypothetical protein
MATDGPANSSSFSEIFIALGFCLRRGLENPKGRIAKLMKKSGFDSPEVLRPIHFDLTPEQ